jgi:branched-chain amino acid transport system permease protein
MTNRLYVVLCVTLSVTLLVALPGLLPSGLLNAAIHMLIAALFATAYNVLAGQGGMLAFGHAAYFGIGAFAVVHAMNALGGQGLLPAPLVPAAGGVAGCILGLVAGWFSTQRTGVYFSMITLALAELIHALSPQLKSAFGGEEGVSSMRMPAWGMTFGSEAEVYYLTLAWTLISIAFLFHFTRTPLGRITLGMRENSNRLRFLGYEVHRLRLLVFVISATFSGIAGGLQAVTNESANYVLFDVGVSAGVVLNAYIGGVNVFFGPPLGAAVMTFFGSALSDLTRSWMLYQGVLFVIVMMFLPSGISGVSPLLRQLWRRKPSAIRFWLFLIGWSLAMAVTMSGLVLAVELLQRVFSRDYQSLLQTGSAWPSTRLFGHDWLPGAVTTWLLPAGLICLGVIAVRDINQRWSSELQVEGA